MLRRNKFHIHEQLPGCLIPDYTMKVAKFLRVKNQALSNAFTHNPKRPGLLQL